MKLYVDDGKKFMLVWSSTAHNTYSRWILATARLDHIKAESFSLVFHTKYATGCRNSIGLDDIKFHMCPTGVYLVVCVIMSNRISLCQIKVYVWRTRSKHLKIEEY